MRTRSTAARNPGTQGGGRWSSYVPRQGFSLAELLGVLVIAAVLVGITAPRIEIVKYRMDGSSRGAAMALVTAQRVAVHRQHDVVVAFDLSSMRIRIHEDANNNGVIDPGERVRWVELQESVLFGLGKAPPRGEVTAAVSFTETQDGLPAVRFIRSGSASEEGGFYLASSRAVEDAKFAKDARAVQVDRGTGRVSWYYFDPPEWRQGF